VRAEKPDINDGLGSKSKEGSLKLPSFIFPHYPYGQLDTN